MRSLLLYSFAVMLMPSAAMAAEPPAAPKSFCSVVGKLLDGCAAETQPRNRHAEVQLDFSIEGPERKLVASVVDSTVKTGVVVPAERRERKRTVRVEEQQSEWCNPKKD